MGGTTKEENKISSSSSISGQQGQTTQQLTPWAGTSGLLGRIFDQLNTAPTGLTSAETTALDTLAGKAAAGNPYAPAIGGVATELLGGGIDRTPMANAAYDEYRRAIAPTAAGDYLDPNKIRSSRRSPTPSAMTSPTG
jgi:hypothetical protein